MLLIFDCDGVLIDSERILNQVFQECLKNIGLVLSLDETIQRFKGRSTKDSLKIAEQMLGKPVATETIVAEYEKIGSKRFHEDIKPIPGITEALSKMLHRRCVASSSSHEHIRAGLENTGLLSYFANAIFSASEVEKGKPAPDLFLHAASSIGVKPRDCIVIEDSVPGVEAAVAANMSVLGYVDLTPEWELKRAGAQTFDNMAMLPDLVEVIRAVDSGEFNI